MKNNKCPRPDGYVTCLEAARELGCSYPFIRLCVKDGRLRGKEVEWLKRKVNFVSTISLEKLRPQLSYTSTTKYNRVGRKYKYKESRLPTMVNGYIYEYRPEHARANQRGYVPQHYLVAEKMLHRKLRPDEVVHHKNRKRDDNRPENLTVYGSQGEHMSKEHSRFIRYTLKVRGNPILEKRVIRFIKKILAEQQ